MHEPAFMEVVEGICQKDPRYAPDTYCFLREALDFTVKLLKKPQQGRGRHVSGKELLDGLRQYALTEFGPMSLTVLRTWGISRTEDFGEVVFNLCEHGVLGRTDEDRREDFAGGYDFVEAFSAPFEPAPRERGTAAPREVSLARPSGDGES